MLSISNCPHCQFSISPEFQLEDWSSEIQSANKPTEEFTNHKHLSSGDCPRCKRWLVIAKCQDCGNQYLNINESPTVPLCHLCEGILSPTLFTTQTSDELRNREAKLRTIFGRLCAGIMLTAVLLQLILALTIIS